MFNFEDIDQKVLKRFEIINKVKKVSTGMIWKAVDRKQNNEIALKKINIFANEINVSKTFREIAILEEIEELKKHPSIMKVLQKINLGIDKYVVYDFMEMDLISLIKVKVLESRHIQVILCNLLVALYFIHTGGLVHLGLTPSKILVDLECKIKLLGFGFSQLLPIKNPQYTSIHYLAPEILLQEKVNESADIWSLGCILGEMLSFHQLFNGTSTVNQLEQIVELIGKPTDLNLNEKGEEIFSQIETEKKKSFTSITDQKIAIDLLKKMLDWNPKTRITIPDILKHSYLSDFGKSIKLKPANSQFIFEDKEDYQILLKHFRSDQQSINASYYQDLESSKTPMSKQKTSTKIKHNSPILTPKVQKDEKLK